jgi:hypothetical protein
MAVQFGAVIAVSRQQSPRRNGLLLAANITEIDISIPTQPAWTTQDINNLHAEHISTITRGSALAWLGHLHVSHNRRRRRLGHPSPHHPDTCHRLRFPLSYIQLQPVQPERGQLLG